MGHYTHMLKNRKASFETNESGFTLIELIVVMAILTALVLLAAPQFLGYTKDAKVAALRQDVKIAEDAVMLYHIDNGEWPVTDELIYEEPWFLDAIGVDEDAVMYRLDTNALKDGQYVKNFSDDDVTFQLVTSGPDEGTVIIGNGDEQEDRNGTTVYGVGLELTEAEREAVEAIEP